MGVRFQRSHFRQTTHSRPRAESNASRRPTGNGSTDSLVPRLEWQKMHVEYKRPPHIVVVDSKCARPPLITGPSAAETTRALSAYHETVEDYTKELQRRG